MEVIFLAKSKWATFFGPNVKLILFVHHKGIGIPYGPEETPVNLYSVSKQIEVEYRGTIEANGLAPLRIVYECGRHITGPAGYILSRVIHRKQTHKSYLGVDASMVNLMRPSMYGAYHHMTVIPDRVKPQTTRTRSESTENASNGCKEVLYDVVSFRWPS